MFFNKDIDSYFIDFLTIPQLAIYASLSKSTNNLFKQSKYYPEYKLCTKYSLDNICNICDINLLKKALREFNHTNKFLRNILIKKCEQGKLDCVKFLIDKGVNYRVKNDRAIIVAAKNGYLHVVKYLIEKGADYRVRNNEALLSAIENDCLEIVKFLVLKDMDHKVKNECIYYAVFYGRLKIVKFLSALDSNYPGSIEWAAFNGHLNVIKFLISRDTKDKVDEFTICKIIRKGYLKVIKLLIKGSIDYTILHQWAIIYAAEYGQLNIVKYFIIMDISHRINNNYALQKAVKNGHSEVAKFLIGEGSENNNII